MADDAELGDDVGWWDCSLCTYKNSADKFKCEICDLRRGTSTRKPRCNADTIVAQVVKQQEQIRQQTRAKPSTPKNVRSSTSNNDGPTTSTEGHLRTKKSHRTSESKGPNDSNNEEDDDEDDEERDHVSDSASDDKEPKPKKRKPSHKSKKKQPSGSSSAKKLTKAAESDLEPSDSEHSDTTDKLSHSTGSPRNTRERSSSVSSSSSNFSPNYSTSPERAISSPNHHNHPSNSSNVPIKQEDVDGPLSKITPVEIRGNLIKFAPPTSTGRTGLIIDKKRFTQHSVTVNDVTITFTEFATRQNKYVRKKKKRREHTRSRPQVINDNSTNNNDSNNNQSEL